MKPTDYRNSTFHDLQRQLVHLRLSVWDALAHHGPCTTRELATACGMDILTVRPRVTELVQMGFAECLSDSSHPSLKLRRPSEGNEGVYRALTTAEAEGLFNQRKKEATSLQLTFDV